MAYPTERSFADVLHDIASNIQDIIRSEIRLAKTEVKEETGKAAKATWVIALGAVLALYAGGFLLLTAIRALDIVVAPWVAGLIVTASVGICSFVCISTGLKRMKRVRPAPQRTIQTMKENVEWVKGHTR
jgi:uncharacterized membrane protein YqjE